MKKLIILATALLSLASAASAQESSNSGVRKRDANASRTPEQPAAPGVTDRMKQRFGDGNGNLSEGDVQWMRIVYRQLDLNKDQNAPLYFPEDIVDGQENLFRIIMRLLANDQIAAYEYLDGREVFTDEYKVKVGEMLDRYYIYHEEAKGSTEKSPKYEIQESDIPTTEVLTYYIIERWEFDNRNNRMRTYVDAICPVLHRSGDFGGEALKYPMFWIKYADLRPHLTQQSIFISDDNNLPTCTYDDFFNLTLYDGEIYKTRNLKNKSMMQLYPDPDDLKRAQDSIQARLEGYEDKLWVPNREDIIAARKAREEAEANAADEGSVIDGASPVVSDADAKKPVRSTARAAKSEKPKATATKKKTSKPKQSKPKSVSSGSDKSNSNAAKSVRRRK